MMQIQGDFYHPEEPFPVDNETGLDSKIGKQIACLWRGMSSNGFRMFCFGLFIYIFYSEEPKLRYALHAAPV